MGEKKITERVVFSRSFHPHSFLGSWRFLTADDICLCMGRLCALTLGSHGWRWCYQAGWMSCATHSGCQVSIVPCWEPFFPSYPPPLPPLLKWRQRLLQSVRRQDEAVSTTLLPRDLVWIWKLLVSIRVALCSKQRLWFRKPCRNQLLISRTRLWQGCSWFLVQLYFVGRTAAWPLPWCRCQHAQTKISENPI